MGELLVVLFVALLVFGGKLPETAKKLGHALSEFKRGMRDELRKVEDGARENPAPPPRWRPEKTPPAAEAPAADEPAEAPAADGPAEPTRREP